MPVRSRCEQADQDSGAGVEQNTAEESLAGCTDLSMRGKRRNIQISAKTEHRMPFHPGLSPLGIPGTHRTQGRGGIILEQCTLRASEQLAVTDTGQWAQRLGSLRGDEPEAVPSQSLT